MCKCVQICGSVEMDMCREMEICKCAHVLCKCATVQRNGVGVQKHRQQPPVDSAGHDLRVFGEFTVS